jgi:hypothetical protein
MAREHRNGKESPGNMNWPPGVNPAAKVNSGMWGAISPTWPARGLPSSENNPPAGVDTHEL